MNEPLHSQRFNIQAQSMSSEQRKFVYRVHLIPILIILIPMKRFNQRGRDISNSSSCIVNFALWCLLSIRTGDKTLAVCLKLFFIKHDHLYHKGRSGAQVQLVRLSNRVRRVAAIQKCRPICSIAMNDNIIEHDRSIVEDVYAIFGRFSGYRPRMN